jgi:hypothetical protein
MFIVNIRRNVWMQFVGTVMFPIVKPGGAYIDHWALEG